MELNDSAHGPKMTVPRRIFVYEYTSVNIVILFLAKYVILKKCNTLQMDSLEENKKRNKRADIKKDGK